MGISGLKPRVSFPDIILAPLHNGARLRDARPIHITYLPNSRKISLHLQAPIDAKTANPERSTLLACALARAQLWFACSTDSGTRVRNTSLWVSSFRTLSRPIQWCESVRHEETAYCALYILSTQTFVYHCRSAIPPSACRDWFSARNDAWQMFVFSEILETVGMETLLILRSLSPV